MSANKRAILRKKHSKMPLEVKYIQKKISRRPEKSEARNPKLDNSGVVTGCMLPGVVLETISNDQSLS
jgi:hypothetical protein